MLCVRLGDKTRLHRFPTIAGPLLNKRDIRKQTKATTHVANPGLDTKMKTVTLVLQEIAIASPMTHEISSMPSVMDIMRMKLIDSQPSART